MVVGSALKRRSSMFQRKARVFPVLALTALLSLAPFAEASATDGGESGGSLGLVASVEAGITSIWTSLTSIWGEVGVRIDDNG
jgi:hypothetical protein